MGTISGYFTVWRVDAKGQKKIHGAAALTFHRADWRAVLIWQAVLNSREKDSREMILRRIWRLGKPEKGNQRRGWFV